MRKIKFVSLLLLSAVFFILGALFLSFKTNKNAPAVDHEVLIPQEFERDLLASGNTMTSMRQ